MKNGKNVRWKIVMVYNNFVNDNEVIYWQSEWKVTYQQLLDILLQMDKTELGQKVLIQNYEDNIAADCSELDFYQIDLGGRGEGDGQWVFTK